MIGLKWIIHKKSAPKSTFSACIICCLVLELSAEELAVEASDIGEGDGFGALGGASAGVGTVTESEFVHLGNHRFGASSCLDLTLGQECELADLGGDEEHRRAVLTCCSAGTATDTGRCVHRLVGYRLGDRNGVSIGYTASIYTDEASGLHDLIVRTAIYHEVLDYREST